MIEDAVKQVLASRAEEAPVRADGRAMLERVGRRERVQARSRVVAAAAAVAVLAGGGAWWSGRAVPAEGEISAPRPQPSPSLRSAGWGNLRFDVPSTWTVNDVEGHHYPMGAMVDGPFLGTLRTGPMCRPIRSNGRGCSRSWGILDKHPTDGVVAWIRAGSGAFGEQREQGERITGADDICAPGGTHYYVYRHVPRKDGHTRVALDGCVYGPRTQEYLRELRAVASSMRTTED